MENYTYAIENNEVTITKCDTTVAGEIAVPSEIDGYPVVCVEDAAFKGCNMLTKITIPASVTALAPNAFRDCPKLSEIIVDANNPAYYSENGVLIDAGYQKLLRYPPEHDGSEYAIPENVRQIFPGAFYGARHLKRITVHDKVKFIGAGSFFGCTALEEILIDSKAPHDTSRDGVWFSQDMTSLCWVPLGKKQTGYCIPEGVTMIFMAFMNNRSLKRVGIPDTVNCIVAHSFDGCDALTDVYYSGSPEQWKAVEIGDGNECLEKATIHYHCDLDSVNKAMKN